MDNTLEINLQKLLGVTKEPCKQQLVLYIPNKDKNGKEIKDLEYWIKEAKKLLTLIGGGATAMPPSDGTWLDPEKHIESIDELKDEDIIWEKTTIIYTFINVDKFLKNLSSLRKFLHKFGRETSQGEVVFEFDGKFYKIDKFDKK